MKEKIREWIGRYLPAEVTSYFSVLVVLGTTYLITRDLGTTSQTIAAVAGYASYFILIFSRDIYATKINLEEMGHNMNSKDVKINLRNLFIEFAPSSTIRYFYYLGAITPITNLINDPGYGQYLTLVSGSILYYIITITSYEIVKKYLRKELYNKPKAHHLSPQIDQTQFEDLHQQEINSNYYNNQKKL